MNESHVLLTCLLTDSLRNKKSLVTLTHTRRDYTTLGIWLACGSVGLVYLIGRFSAIPCPSEQTIT
jgi:hypothetical protein